ncbi:DUF4913 domain-containing protein [Streptomyces sp. NPDC059850]|uniref:DUF4913 domain-containing protein n=1 Tax=Streptomyces sp. NPDC059850 TaxID=3346970 RepID=UPI00364AAB58
MSTATTEVAESDRDAAPTQTAPAEGGDAAKEETPSPPNFILYKEGPEYVQELRQLTLWAHHVLLPVYGREVTSSYPWCSSWWEHPEAVAQLHGLWLAWAELTGPGSGRCGPANWHRDYLQQVMTSLRDPSGPFAGCKAGSHRPKETPRIERADPFAPPPPPPAQA